VAVEVAHGGGDHQPLGRDALAACAEGITQALLLVDHGRTLAQLVGFPYIYVSLMELL
jgi:hypothetical protein